METTEHYIVKSGSFEGPLGMLLELIEAHKLHINDVTLAEVAGEYLAKIKEKTYPISQASYFLYVAATLILIKSKSLLPNLQLTEEETQSVDMLERRLRAYKIITEAEDALRTHFGETVLYAQEERSKNAQRVFAAHPGITLEQMTASAQSVIMRFIKHEALQEVHVEKTINIEEILESVRSRIESSLKELSFRDMVSGKGGTSREQAVVVIVSFLAILELVREGLLDVEQSSHDADISIKKRDHATMQEPITEEINGTDA